MSLVGTLGRLAVGALVAKGASKLLKNKMGAGNRGGATRINQPPGGSAGGMGSLLGGNTGSSGGNLSDILGGGGQQGGGLGGLLDSLGGAVGGAAANTGGSGGSPSLGELLNSVIKGDSGNTVAAEPEQETQAAVMLRAMFNAAKSDGRLDESERQKITGQLGDLSQDDIAFVQKEMAAPLDLPSFINSVPRGMEQQIYLMSLMAIDLDSKAEADYLDKLAKGLGISESVSNQIHQRLGAPTLYT